MKRKLAQPLLITRVLIGLNLAMFALQIVNGASLGSLFGGGAARNTAFDFDWTLFVSGVGAGQWWRLVTSGFMHFGAIHIGFNMLILYRLGQDLESGIGRLRFATIYFASLLGGSLAVVLLDAKGITGGASGAVFGMAGAATIALWQRGVRFYNTGWGPMLAVNLLLTFALPNISVGGHFGGLTVGVVLGWLLLRPNASKSQTRVGYLVAVAIIVATFAIAVPYAHNRHPSCVSSGTELACLPGDF